MLFRSVHRRRHFPCWPSRASTRGPCSLWPAPAPAGHWPRSPFGLAAPALLHRARLLARLHRPSPPCPPVLQASDALQFQAACLVTVLLVRPFVSSHQLLRPRLTSRCASSASGFRPQGEISPGKNALLRCTTVRFTPPPLGHKSFADSCPSARNLCASLPFHTRSPSCSCASLRSL